MKTFTLAAFIALSLLPGSTLGGLVGVPNITLDNPASTINSHANLVGINVGPLTDTIIPVASISATSSGSVYYGTANGNPGAAGAITGLDISNGLANNNDLNLIFDIPVNGLNGSESDVAVFDISIGTQTDQWTFTPIIGGTAAAPVFGGAPLVFNQNFFADTGIDLNFKGVGTQTQSLYGGGFDFSDLGLTPGVDELIGVRVETTGGDPALIVGLNNDPFSSISEITVDNPSPPRVDTNSNLLDLEIGAGATVVEIVPVDTVTGSASSPYWGRSFGAGGSVTVSEALTDLSLTTGKANSVDNDFWFSKALPNANGNAADVAIFEIATGNQGDSWTVKPIVGGSPGAPIYGPSYTLASQGTRFADTGLQINATRNGSESLPQNIYGAGVDFSGFFNGEILGINILSSSGDPSLIVGLITVPEPSSALTLLGSLFLCVLRHRRKRVR